MSTRRIYCSIATGSGHPDYLGHLGHFSLGHMGQLDRTIANRDDPVCIVKSVAYEVISSYFVAAM